MRRERTQTQILDELYKTSRMGMEASEIMLPRVHDEELRGQIKRQDETYINTMERAHAMLRQIGKEPAGVSRTARGMLRSSVRMNTLLDRSPRHLANLMIKGSTLGIVNMTSALNRSPDDGTQVHRLAEGYIGAEEKNIDRLKKFL
ncbi:MAG TPA: hypothetical protein DEB16_06865 [Ruminococcaceae bacterium]|jgi:hypothetical protein|nr:hypothetical protein [Oscillospiraceae bacterium]HBG55596.1 hypothetical protein [Oscillospiraceae bacterium]HBQ47036.1 hypothetical protein [Oscillospiraceae bacterium]HBT91549.1 hypothetical protein [Oscillospiraceae bacterium]HCB91240.1 hypothetical protein [Oscillospiraceae bacterium]